MTEIPCTEREIVTEKGHNIIKLPGIDSCTGVVMLWKDSLGVTVGHYAIMDTEKKLFDYTGFAAKMLEAAGGAANVTSVILVGRDCKKALGDGTAEATWLSVLGPEFYDEEFKPTAHMAFVIPKDQVDVFVSLVGGLTITNKKNGATTTLSFIACSAKIDHILAN